MSHIVRNRSASVVTIAALIVVCAAASYAQDNPYRVVEGWAKLPDGRIWGSTAAVDVDAKDNIYVADSESNSVRTHPGWKRGIRIGHISDGYVTAFIPDPVESTMGTSAAEGVAADSLGNIYGAEVGPKALKKYVRK